MGVGNSGATPSFLQNNDNGDIMSLRRKINQLESENKQLRDQSDAKQGLERLNVNSKVTDNDRNWMSSFGSTSGTAGGMRGNSSSKNMLGQIDRPATASQQNARVREVQEELKQEKRAKLKLMEQIENLKSEI